MTTKVHHIVIGGFGQHRGRLAGVDHVVALLDRYRAPGVRVTMLPWRHDWKAEAAFIRRHAPATQPVVCIYAYSWGVGSGAVTLAEQLRAREVDVYGLVACDGVYRHRIFCPRWLDWLLPRWQLWPRWLTQWRAFWPGSVIRLPANVDRHNVTAFVQRNTLPAGHRIVDARGRDVETQELKTVMIDGKFAELATHVNMDESSSWHNACVHLAERATLEAAGKETF